MKSQEIAADIGAHLRARCSLLWIVTREEARAEFHLFNAASQAGYVPRTWDVSQGAAEFSGKPFPRSGQDPADMLNFIEAQARGSNNQPAERGIWIMRDLPPWLEEMPGAALRRKLRNLARLLPTIAKDRAQALIILSPSSDVPAELANHATVIDWPLPDREEIAEILDSAIQGLPEEMRAQAAPNGARDAAIDAALGLSGEEAASCYAKSLVKLRRIDAPTVAAEKKRVIAQAAGLQWYDPPADGLAAVGGLDGLKAWLIARKGAFSPAARDYGLPTPKGVLLVGIAGTGKSLSAKAVGAAWQRPVLRFDMGATKDKYVGGSEANIRRTLKLAETVAPCVLWIDEIEKVMAGATQGAADGGVSADQLGTFLTWMQEKTAPVFVIATANDVESLPPEILRKGRFDELFFVDLPTTKERAEILAASLRPHAQHADAVNCAEVAAATPGFTGAELAALVPDALYAAFSDGSRNLTTADLLDAAKVTQPLSKTAAEKVERLQKWAAGRCRRASTAETVTTTQGGRAIDVD